MKKIRRKIEVTFSLISLLIIVLLSITSIITNSATARTLAGQTMPIIATILTGRVDGYIAQNIDFLNSLAEADAFKTDAPLIERMQVLKKMTVGIADGKNDFGIMDLTGQMITVMGIQADVSKETYYTGVLNSGKTYVSPVQYNRFTDEFSFMISSPVYVDGRLHSILGYAIPVSIIGDFLNAMRIGQTGYALLFNTDGQVISLSANSAEQSKTNALIDLNSLRQLGSHIVQYEKGMTEFETDNILRTAAFETSQITGWRVAVIVNNNALYLGSSLAGRISLIIALIMLPVAIIASYIVGRNLSNPIVAVTNEAIKLGGGQLNLDFSVKSKDETGVMAQSLANGVRAIRSLVLLTSQAIDTVKQSSQELAATASQSAQAVHRILSGIQNVKEQVINQSAGVNQTEASIEQIVASIEKLNADIEAQSENVANSSHSTEQMITSIDSIADILQKNTAQVSQLGAAAYDGRESIEQTNVITRKLLSESDGLLEASSIIDNIAAQTNLLAMNAAIEAAHAGEAGKGFAVVADEIRKLAENSSVQSKSITQVLYKLKTDIEQLTQAASFVQQQFTVIFELTQAVLKQDKNLSGMMQNQAGMNEEVLASIRKISGINGDIRESSSLMLRSSREIHAEMGKLAEVTDALNNNMNTMAGSTKEISAAVDSIKVLSEQNTGSISEVSLTIGKFIV